MVRWGETLSLFATACRVCDLAGVPATSKPGGNPPAGGFSITVSPSRCRTARRAGPDARWILLAGAEPTELSPGWSHSRPARDSQPSGLRRSALCASRQSAFSFSQGFSCAAASPGSTANTRAVKARQAERFLKRMRKYTVKENTPKMKMRRKSMTTPQIVWRRGTWNWKRITELQKYDSPALLFTWKYTGGRSG